MLGRLRRRFQACMAATYTLLVAQRSATCSVRILDVATVRTAYIKHSIARGSEERGRERGPAGPAFGRSRAARARAQPCTCCCHPNLPFYHCATDMPSLAISQRCNMRMSSSVMPRSSTLYVRLPQKAYSQRLTVFLSKTPRGTLCPRKVGLI